MALEIHQIPTRKDNYVYLLRDSAEGKVGVVDPSDAEPVIQKLDALGWTLTHILNTHHHNDHTGGNLELKEKYGCIVVGPRADHDRIAGIDVDVGDGDTYALGGAVAQSLIGIGWQGWHSKEDFITRQKDDPYIISMGMEDQRALATSS